MIRKKSLVLLILSFICLKAIAQKQPGEYLIVLDVQPQFYTGSPNEKDAREMIHTINKLTEKFSPENVVYIKSAGKSLSISFKGIKVKTIPPPELDSTLRIVSSQIFTKTGGDAFQQSDLEKLLKAGGAKKIVIAGLLAEKCVFHTALGGKEKAYDISVISDAVIGKSEKSKQKAFRKLSEKGVRIITSRDL
ncbi:MAG: cysteine hydrolase family protein [Bacteroidales bacterium]